MLLFSKLLNLVLLLGDQGTLACEQLILFLIEEVLFLSEVSLSLFQLCVFFAQFLLNGLQLNFLLQ